MRKGFTLIELLVVIAIIAILAAILFPVFSKAREKARQTDCMSKQKQIATAVQIYAQENDEALPALADWTGTTLVSANMKKCKNESGAISYGMNASLLGSSLGAVQDGTSDVILTADSQVDSMATSANIKSRHNNGFIASFLDSHVQYFKAATTGETAATPYDTVLAGAGSIYKFDGSSMIGQGVTLTTTAGGTVYFAVTASAAVAAATQICDAPVLSLPIVAATNVGKYYVFAVTVTAPNTKATLVPSGGKIVVTLAP